MNALFLFLAGMGLLIAGAELLVRGGVNLATRLGVPSLLIGLTIVAYGTSTPELAISVKAALIGNADISLGNVVGSNIFNILFILGLSALVTPLSVSRQLIRWDVPIMIGVSWLLVGMSRDGIISRLDGLMLFVGVILYTVFVIWVSKKEQAKVKMEDRPAPPAKAAGWIASIIVIVVGLVILVWGSNWMVEGAVRIAKSLGVSDLIIGLTIVAAGTSMPELATSILAAIRGQRDIAVGNVVGSNIYNILAILGLAALIAPHGVAVSPSALHFDIPVMVAVAVACLPIFMTGFCITRWEGALFVAYYVFYTIYLLLQAGQHAALPMFSSVMMYFVVPLTVLGLGISLIQAVKNRSLLKRES